MNHFLNTAFKCSEADSLLAQLRLRLITCDETVMPQDMGMRQVFSMDAYGCSDVTFGGASNASLETHWMTANNHAITIYSIKDLELAIFVIHGELES